MSQFIRCDYCNKANYINEKTLYNPMITSFSCIHCTEKLDTSKIQYKINNNIHSAEEEKNNIVIDTIKLLAIITVLVFATMKFYDYQNNKTSRKKNDSQIDIDSSASNYVENLLKNNFKIIQNPKSGIHLDLINKKRVAPFTIITNGYSNYYVKLKLIGDEQKYLTIFINKGDRISTKVPLGMYILTYTAGEEWYGTKHLFGKQSAHKAESIFSFTENQQTTYGHTVTLYGVVNGNLQKSTIDKNDF